MLPAYDFSAGVIFIISVESATNEYIIYTVKNAMNSLLVIRKLRKNGKTYHCSVEAASRSQAGLVFLALLARDTEQERRYVTEDKTQPGLSPSSRSPESASAPFFDKRFNESFNVFLPLGCLRRAHAVSLGLQFSFLNP